MVNKHLHIIMPIKDSIEMAEKAILAIVNSGHTVCVYDDNSTPENAQKLDSIAQQHNIQLIHLSSLTDHPSPNYRLVLQHARNTALSKGQHLVIVESDVMVQDDTLNRMVKQVSNGIGMVAAVTTNEEGVYNFPYH